MVLLTNMGHFKSEKSHIVFIVLNCFLLIKREYMGKNYIGKTHKKTNLREVIIH